MSENGKYYRAPWGVMRLTLTFSIVAFTWIILIAFLLATPPVFSGVMLMIFVQLIFLIIFYQSPKGYYLKADRIIIDKGRPKVEIPLLKIKEISYKRCWYEIGVLVLYLNYGLFIFGYFGYFWSSRIGRFQGYCRRWKKFVLITTNESEKYVISPSKPKEFIKDLRNLIEKKKSIEFESFSSELVEEEADEHQFAEVIKD